MKSVIVFVGLLLFASLSFGFGTPYRVESLDKAKSLQVKDPSKHILIFYTRPAG